MNGWLAQAEVEAPEDFQRIAEEQHVTALLLRRKSRWVGHDKPKGSIHRTSQTSFVGVLRWTGVHSLRDAEDRSMGRSRAFRELKIRVFLARQQSVSLCLISPWKLLTLLRGRRTGYI